MQLLQLLRICGVIITQVSYRGGESIQAILHQHVLLFDYVHGAVDDEHAVHAGVLSNLRLLWLLLPGVLRQKQPLCPERSSS